MRKNDNASVMFKLVKDFETSNKSQKEFAAAHGIKPGKLSYWIFKLTKDQQAVSLLSASDNNFVPITLTSEDEMRSIIIRCTSGVEIEIPL